MPDINIENVKPRQGLIVYVATSNIISKVVTHRHDKSLKIT